MRCCVPFCRNTADNVRSAKGRHEGITFHSFPSEEHLRAAWLQALGKEDTPLPDSAVVCSQHFLSDDISESVSGSKQIVLGAVPSTVLVCMMCLDTDSKQVLMSKYKLDEAYEEFIGFPVCDLSSLKQTLCVLCAHRLINVSRFRDNSLRARSLMKDLVEKHNLITMRHVKMMSRETNLLKSRFVMTTPGPDQCDLHIVEELNEDKQTESNEIIHKDEETFVVKSEGNCDYVLVDEHMEVGQYPVSDEIVLESKLLGDALQEAASVEHVTRVRDLIKYESDTFECSLCSEVFLQEQEYDAHIMSTHLQHGDGDSECVTADSTDQDIAEHKHALQILDDNCTPSAEVVQYSVAPPLLSILTNKEADTIIKSDPVLDINNCRLDNLSSDTNNQVANTDISAFTNSRSQTQRSGECVISCDRPHVDTASTESHCQTTSALAHTHTDNMLTHTGDKPYSCNICQYKCKRKSHLIIHMRTHTGEKPYSCNLCEYKCNQNCQLVIHMRTHTGEKPYSCELCEYKCGVKISLVRHMSLHSGEKLYACNICDYKCNKNSQLVIHIRTHTGEKPYSCKLCEYKCKVKSSLVRHMLLHTGEKPYSCNLCDYKCNENSSLVKHMRIHTGVKHYSCKFCEYICNQNRHLVTHMRSHTGEKLYSCKLCEYKCNGKNRLVIHMRTHTGEKPYSCKLCDYKCNENGSLVIHMRVHTGEKPYSCKFCEYKCKVKSSLITHMRTHTGEKPYSCNLCEFKCNRNNNLVIHKRTHTDEKPYSCELCEYKCRVKISLVKHMLLHTRKKRHACKLCGYKCTQNSHLVVHMRKHTGDKPYSCELCNYKCKGKSGLVSHMRTHTSGGPYLFL
ncbi:zinc finger protein 271-like isoform X1 [Bicyclus anynana]|uniref:Zinc finger protein 271-like isoform X1 n=2 Tax=Bicyclus anynana TaxID=110368 RepID=A0A6J1P2K6_BICAN|nr:zinc finger protein 271-like isoform X1 [Bicyclus anynana]